MAKLILTNADQGNQVPLANGLDWDVTGTNGVDDVVVAAGAVADLNLLGGEDNVVFAGNSTDYTILVSGTTVSFIYTGGNTVTVPASTVANTITFADGETASLVIDTDAGTVNLGTQVITDTAAAVSGTTTGAEPDLGPFPKPAGETNNPTFSVSTSDVSEGDTATFTVTLTNADAAESYTVDYAVSLEGTTTADDHGAVTAEGDAGATGTITFAAGETEKTITIPVTSDAISPETGEGITVTLSNATGTDAEVSATNGDATADIIDVPLSFELTQSPSSVTEGGTISYTLTASAPVESDVSVSFAVQPGNASAANAGTTTTNLNDFDQGTFNPTVLTIPAGSTSVTFDLLTTDDGITELPETYSVVATADGEDYEIETTLLDGGGGGKTFDMTTGVDSGDAFKGTSKDDTYNANTNELSAFDNIDGVASDDNDTLNVTYTGGAIATANVTVANIENAVFQGDAGATIDTTTWTGLQNVSAAGAGALSLTAATTTAVSVQNYVAGGNAVAITGGSTVTVNTASTTGANNVAVTSGTKGALTSVSLTNVDAGQDVTITDDNATADTLTSVTLNDVTDANDGDIAVNSDALTSLTLTSLLDNSVTNTGAGASRALTVTLNDVEGGTITDANATGVTIATTGAASGDTTGKMLDLAFAAATTVAINADEMLKVNAATLTAATSLTVSGDSAVMLPDLTGATKLAAVNLSASTGNNTIADLKADIASLAVTGGAGNDNITTSGALDAKAVVNLGAGDDTYAFDAAAASGASVTGGAGSDTLGVADGKWLDATAATVYSGFETLEVAGGTGDYDMSLLGLTDLKLTDTALTGAVSITKATSGSTVTFGASEADGKTATVDLTQGANTLTLALSDATGKSDSLAFVLNAEDTGTDQTAEGQAKATLTANGIESFTIESNATTASKESAAGKGDQLTEAKYLNELVLTADSATKLTLTGDAQLKVTLGAEIAGDQDMVVTLIDATGNTAGVNVEANVVDTSAGDGAINTTAVTFNGSSGADTFNASGRGDTVQGNAGADAITFHATTGDDTARYVAATDSQLTLTDANSDGKADTATGFDAITAFGTAGDDIIELSSQLGLATGDARSDILQKGLIAGTTAADLETFIGTGTDFFDTGLVDRAVAFANDGTDGYLFIDANSDGNFTAADDMFIELSGVTTFALSDVSFG